MSETKNSIDPFRSRDKQQSWNEFGSAYWTLAATTSHPSEEETSGFLGETTVGSRVLVAGATTGEVIGAAIARGAEVHVLDFADKLLKLASDRFANSFEPHLHDVTNPPPSDLAGTFDIVIADRLVNRFHRSEMPGVVSNLMAFAKANGQLRLSFRFGLYPLDERLIQRGTELGTVSKFWDETTRTLDWSGVNTEIDDVAENHGEIPASVVADWSRMRGVESRILLEDIPAIAEEASTTGNRIKFGSAMDMDVALTSKTFIVTREDDGR